MKPSWDNAPEWAQWLAQDECGDWWWFQYRPVCGETTWWPSSCAGEWMAVEDAPPNWRDTLEQRPTDRRDIISPDERAAIAEQFSATNSDEPHEPRPDELEDLFRDGEGEPWTWPRGATVRNVSAVLEEAPGAAIRYRVRYQRRVDGTWRDCDHASWFREDVEKIRADLLREAGDSCSICGEPGVEHRDTGCPPRHPGFPGGMGQP